MCQQSFEFHRFSSLTSIINDGKALRKENTIIRISCTKRGTCCIVWISNGYLINCDCTEMGTERATYVRNFNYLPRLDSGFQNYYPNLDFGQFVRVNLATQKIDFRWKRKSYCSKLPFEKGLVWFRIPCIFFSKETKSIKFSRDSWFSPTQHKVPGIVVEGKWEVTRSCFVVWSNLQKGAGEGGTRASFKPIGVHSNANWGVEQWA